MQLKPIDRQVVAIVGASSGIGREIAFQFARSYPNDPLTLYLR